VTQITCESGLTRCACATLRCELLQRGLGDPLRRGAVLDAKSDQKGSTSESE